MATESPELFDDIYLGLQAGGAVRKQRRGEPLSAEEEEVIGRWSRLSLWRKFIVASAIGSVGAVVRVPIGIWRQSPEVRDMIERAAQEAMAVARARGVQPPEGTIDLARRAVETLPPGYMASLQEDIVEGRPSELEYWAGTVVRLARQSGVATPLNEFIYHSLLPQETKARREF